MPASEKIERFEFQPGRVIARKYVIESFLGDGWQGEVYLIREVDTGIERAAKFFYPHRNHRNKVATAYAKKLYRMRRNSSIIQYHNHEIVAVRGHQVTCLISDLVDGLLLNEYVESHPGKRLPPYLGLHVLYAITKALEGLHAQSEYHGDLHAGNVFINPVGIKFHVKLIDPFDWQDSRRLNISKDVNDLIIMFHSILGGAKHYAKHPPEIKSIICGLKTSLIKKKFRHSGDLRQYLETFEWNV